MIALVYIRLHKIILDYIRLHQVTLHLNSPNNFLTINSDQPITRPKMSQLKQVRFPKKDRKYVGTLDSMKTKKDIQKFPLPHKYILSR